MAIRVIYKFVGSNNNKENNAVRAGLMSVISEKCACRAKFGRQVTACVSMEANVTET